MTENGGISCIISYEVLLGARKGDQAANTAQGWLFGAPLSVPAHENEEGVTEVGEVTGCGNEGREMRGQLFASLSTITVACSCLRPLISPRTERPFLFLGTSADSTKGNSQEMFM